MNLSKNNSLRAFCVKEVSIGSNGCGSGGLGSSRGVIEESFSLSSR